MMKNNCELKAVYVCINHKYQQMDVDKVVKDLEENLQGTGIAVLKGCHGQKPTGEDYVTIGDTGIGSRLLQGDAGDTEVDIGLGSQYAGNAHFVTYEAEDADEAYLRMVWARKFHRPLIIAETGRLLIREMTMEDMDALYELYASLKDCPYVEPLYEREEEEEFSRNYIENMYTFYGYGLWLVFLKRDEKCHEGGQNATDGNVKTNLQLVARVGIENRVIDGQTVQELGYLVNQNFWNQGIAWESCQLALDYAENVLGLKQIYTCIHKENKKSIALAEKLGFLPRQ